MNLYTLVNHDLILDNESRKYILKVRDLPNEEKPREKLLQYGASVLSTAELLAIVLAVGTRKEDVLAMSSRVLKEYGEHSLVGQKNAKAMSKDLDIPLIKAIQIVSCAELGRRFFQKDKGGSVTIRTAKDVFNYLKDMRELPKEHLRGIYLNSHNRIIHDEVISIGSIDANIVHPREVFRPALEYSAAAVVLAHNHPSDVTDPSEADIEVTKQIIGAGKILGIDLLDHVIITKNKFASIVAEYNI